MNLNRQHGLSWLAVCFTVLALAAPSLAAYAHDDVVATSPAAGSTIEAGIVNLELEFSAELLTIAESAEIILLDPAGTLANNGCAQIDGRFLRTQVDLDQAGNYTATWRVVSNDGHPIEGSFEFEVTNESAHVSAGLVAGTDCEWAITDLAGPSENSDDGLSGSIYWLLWLLLPGAGVGLYFWLRPRPKAAS